MSSLIFDARIDDAKLRGDIDKVNARLKGMTEDIKGEGENIDKIFARIGAGMAAYFSTQAISQFIQKMVQVRGEFQKYEAVLTNTLNGDNARAKELLQGISDFAAKTPYQLTEITDAFVKLANQGVMLTNEELKKLGDFAAVTSKPIGQLAEAIMDVNNPERWKEFGARVQTEGDKVMITFKGQKIEFERTIEGAKNAIAQLGSMKGVSGTMESISKTLVGQISNLEDAWDQMLNKLGQANEGTFSGMISGATSLINNYEVVVDTIKVMVATFGAAKAAAVVYNLVMNEQKAITAMVASSNGIFTRSLAMQYLWTERVQKAQALLNKTMLTNPYVLAAAAIIGIVSAIVLLNKKYQVSLDSEKKFQQRTKEIADTYAERIAKAQELIGKVKDETEAESERVKSLEELQKMYPSLFSNYDLHSLKLQKILEDTKLLKEEEKSLEVQRQEQTVTGIAEEIAFIKSKIDNYSKVASVGMGAANSYANIENQRNLDKLKSLQEDYRRENERLNKMYADQAKAQELIRVESEKTIQKRIEEAKSIEALGKLKEEWEKKWKEATTVADRTALAKDIALIDESLKKMKGDGKKSTWKEKLEKELEQAQNDYEKFYAAIRQLGTDWTSKEWQNLQKQGKDFREYLIGKLNAFKDNTEAQILIAQAAQNAGIDLQPTITKEIKPIQSKGVVGKTQLPSTKELADMSGFAEKMAKQAEKFKKNLDESDFERISQGAGDLSMLFSDLSSQFRDIDQNLSVIFSTFSEVFGSVRNLFSGNVFQQIAGAAGLVSTMYKLAMDTTKIEDRLAKPWEEFEKWVAASNRQLEQYIKLRDSAVGSDKYATYDQVIQETLSKIEEAGKKLSDMQLSFTLEGSGWFGAAYKEIDQQLQALYDKLGTGVFKMAGNPREFGIAFWKQVKEVYSYDLDQLLISPNGEFTIERINQLINEGKITDSKVIEAVDNYNQLLDALNQAEQQKQELLTATMAQQVADGILQGFKDGYDSAADFADNFESLMKDAVFNALKIQALEKPLQNWYAQFAEASGSGSMLTAAEISDLQKSYNDIITEAMKRFEDLKKASGMDFSASGDIQQQGMPGAIKGITEETAGIIAGHFYAMREYQTKSFSTAMEQLDGTNQSVTILGKIEQNTRHNAKLNDIDEKLGEMNQTLKKL